AAAAGYLSNKAFFRFTRNNLVNGLLVSIGLISIFESASMLLWTATPVEMHFVLPGALRVGDIGLPKMKLVVFAVIVVVIVATYLALARTWLGRAAFAYAQNPEAAMLMGVHTPRLESAVMLYSTGLAGLGGALYASLYSLEPAMGGVYVLKGMEAAVLGRHPPLGRGGGRARRHRGEHLLQVPAQDLLLRGGDARLRGDDPSRGDELEQRHQRHPRPGGGGQAHHLLAGERPRAHQG